MCHWIVEVRCCCSPDLRHSTVQWRCLARKVSFSANRSAQIESQDRSYDVLLCKKSDFSFGGVFCCFSKSTFNHPPPPPPFPLIVVCCTLDRNAVSCHAAVAVAAAAQWWCIRIVVDGWMDGGQEILSWHWAIPQFYWISYYDEGFPRFSSVRIPLDMFK